MNELTDNEFWDDVWKQPFDLSRFDNLKWVLRNYTYRRFHQVCRTILDYDPEKTFLDIGCGIGDWSIYFHRTFGYKVTAIDSSVPAIAQARLNFQRQNIKAAVIQTDFFDHEGSYDVIYAGGLLEHFADPEPVLEKMHSLLKPGGILINWIPNLQGRTGLVLRLTDPDIFQTHNILTDTDLKTWHRNVGFNRTDIFYDGFICLNMLPIDKAGRFLRFILRGTAKIVNYFSLLFSFLFVHLENRMISSFKVVIAFKPKD